MTPDTAIQRLEKRITALEDRIELLQLFSAFGPAIDSRSGEEIAAFYTATGEYHTDLTGDKPNAGHAGIAAAFNAPMHKTAVDGGAAHLLGLPHIVIDGDKAEAIAHTVLFLRDANGWRIGRAAANRFWCEKGAQGWRIVKRVNRQLGAAEALALFRTGRLDLPWVGEAN